MLLRSLAPLLVFASTLLGPDAAGPISPPDTDLEAAFEAWLAPLLALDVFSGVVLVSDGEEVLLEKAYGMADLEFDVPLEVDHAFRIASISKSFTRALVGRLVERDVLALDDPIAQWLPAYPAAERITVRLLLDHRAGVPNVNSLPYDEEALAPNTLADLVDSLATLPLDFPPASDRRYSNGGYAVLALALERATGAGYAELLEQEVLAPMGLERTTHQADGAIVSGLAHGYMPSPVVAGRMRHAPFQEMTTKTGGGSLVSTAREAWRWARAIGDHPLLERATWEELFPDPDRFAASGRSPGYNAFVLRRGERVAVVLANNYAAGATAEVAGALLALAAGEEPAPLFVTAPTEAIVDPTPFVGSYRAPEGVLPPGMPRTAEIRRVDRDLVLHLEGVPVDVLVPQDGRAFLLRNLWSRITFAAVRSGRSPAIEVDPLYREGSWRAERIDEESTSASDPVVPEEALGIYAAALRFYDPPPGAVRWLDPRLLDGSGKAVRRLSGATVGALLDHLGEGYVRLGNAPDREGGRLRVSPIRRVRPGRFLVVVRYRHESRGYRGEAFDQVFEVQQGVRGWTIVSREGVDRS